MFWNNSFFSSRLETLLNKEDVTLQELMDEEEVLQECRAQNRRLIDYLMRSEVLEELITLTTVEPAGDDYSKYKYSNIACELLTCEVPQLNERLANDKVLMGKLCSFLESDAPLNPLLASFFSKTFSVLIGRTSEQNWYSYQLKCLQVLEFLKYKRKCLSLLLKHIGTSAIMDLLFKLITEVECEAKENMLNWLDDQKLVQSLVKLFDPSVSCDVHSNASQLLCDVIRTARENRKQACDHDPILDRIESPETVSLLLDQILMEPKCETSIIGGISVLLTLLEDEKRDNTEGQCNVYSNAADNVDESTTDAKEPSKVILNTVKAILPRLKDFHDLLINPPQKPSVNTTVGLLDPPLGNTRVEVAKLLSVLVASNNMEVNKELANLDTINVLLDLFFKYTWNNFLHNQVEHCVAVALNCDTSNTEGNELPDNFFIAHLFVKCRLMQRLLDAWDDNETQQNVHKRPRRGYMGHLVKIANNIVRQAEIGPLGALMTELIDSETLNRWKSFLPKLAAINNTCSTCLGGVHPQDISEDPNLREISSYYQLQALAASCPRPYGLYQEEDFDEDEETVIYSNDVKLKKIIFNRNEDDLDQKMAFFIEVCNQSYPTLDPDEVDIMLKKSESKSDENLKSDWPDNLENNSSDEDEPPERSGPDGREDEFNNLSCWSGEGDKVAAPVASANPWDTSSLTSAGLNINSTSPDMGWANFESAPFANALGLNLTPDIKTTIATSSVPSALDTTTTPLDLTPSDGGVTADEIFSKCDEPEQQIEAAQVAENIPRTAVFTNIESIAHTLNDFELRSSEPQSLRGEGETAATTVTTSPTEGGPQKQNSLQSADFIGDVNSTETKSDKDIVDNFRFHSPQGLMTKCGQKNDFESDSSGDGYKLLQENVQTVPNDANQASKKSVDLVESCIPPVTTANVPL